MRNNQVCCGDEGEKSSAPGLNTSGITEPVPIPAREGRAAANTITEIEAEARAYVEAYDQRPPVNLSFKYLIDMLAVIDGMRAESQRRRENAERRLHNALDAIDDLHAEVAALKQAKRAPLREYGDAPPRSKGEET